LTAILATNAGQRKCITVYIKFNGILPPYFNFSTYNLLFMKKCCLLMCFAILTCAAMAQSDSTPSLRSVLLEQLKTTHNVKDWFVPPSIAIAGLTAEQANWKDNSDNHSIAQLTTHLIFWNKQLLDKFVGIKPDAFSGNNKETFTPVNANTWNAAVQRLDSVLTALENAVKSADDQKLKSWYSTIAHVGTHNAYHTGQIIYIRKMKGWWDENNGVK
jgi:DinB superfamily